MYTMQKNANFARYFKTKLISILIHTRLFLGTFPLWGAADAEIKVPSGQNTELRRSPFKAWSRSVYIAIHATLTARNFFLIYTIPVHSPAFFPKPLPVFFLCWLWLSPVSV